MSRREGLRPGGQQSQVRGTAPARRRAGGKRHRPAPPGRGLRGGLSALAAARSQRGGRRQQRGGDPRERESCPPYLPPLGRAAPPGPTRRGLPAVSAEPRGRAARPPQPFVAPARPALSLHRGLVRSAEGRPALCPGATDGGRPGWRPGSCL